MAVEEKVVIRVEIDPDMSKTAAVNTFLATLDKNATKVNKTLHKTSDTFTKDLAKAIAHTGARMADFGMKLVKVNLKAFGVELALVTTGLLAMKAALAVGNGIMKAWSNTVKFARAATAGLAAGITALVATLMAANRQFQQFQLAPFVGGIKQARAAMSSIGTGSTAAMGPQVLSQSMASLAKSGADVAKLAPMMRQIGNISSGDPKQFQALTKAVATVQSSGKTTAGVKALQGMGPAFADAAKQAGGMSSKQFMASLASGGLTPQGFKGQMDTLDSTLMGGAKGMMTRMYVQLADMGQIFLDPIRNAMREVEQVLGNGLFRMQGAIRQFGLNSFIPGFVDVLAKFIDWIVLLVNRDLPKLMDMLTSIGNWWKDFKAGMKKFFTKMGDGMEKFREASAGAWEMVKALFGELKSFLGATFDKWDSGIVRNANAFKEFGHSLGMVITGVLDMLTQAKNTFFDILPQINRFFQFLSNEVFPKMATFANVMVGAFGDLIPILETVLRMLMPVIEAVNMVLGGVGGSGGVGGAMLGMAGMMAMTGGGRAMSGAVRAGAMGAAKPAGLGVFSSLGFSAAGRLGKTTAGTALGLGALKMKEFLGGRFGGADKGLLKGGRLSRGAGLLGGLAGGIGAWKSQSAGSGALSGAAGGASIGGMFGPMGAAVGALLGGAGGAIKGYFNRRKMKDAGEELGKTMVEDVIEGMATQSRTGRADSVKAFNELLGDDAALARKADEKGVDKGALKKSLQSQRNNLLSEQTRLNAALDVSLGRLAETTGKTTEVIETEADQLGIVLSNRLSEAQYIMETTKEYGTWNKGAISASIEGSYYDAVTNGAFAKRTRLESAGEETRAATLGLFTSMESGGSLDNDLADRAMQALMAEGQALGHTGGGLIQWVNKALRGMSGRANQLGFNAGKTQMDDFVNTGLKAGETAKKTWMEGGFAQQLKHRLQLINPEMSGADVDAKLSKAWESGDPDQYLANLNATVHGEAAEKVMELGAKALDAGTSLTKFAAVMEMLMRGDVEGASDWLAERYGSGDGSKHNPDAGPYLGDDPQAKAYYDSLNTPINYSSSANPYG